MTETEQEVQRMLKVLTLDNTGKMLESSNEVRLEGRMGGFYGTRQVRGNQFRAPPYLEIADTKSRAEGVGKALSSMAW